MSVKTDQRALVTIVAGALPPQMLEALIGLGADIVPHDLDQELVLPLAKPIDGPAGPVAQIVIREATAAEIMQWDKLSGAEADVKAISVVAGVPTSVVEKLPARVFYRASRRIGDFLL